MVSYCATSSSDGAEENISTSNDAITRNKLNTMQLAILVFYNVSGGPFGIEPSLRAAGNFYTILGFLILPFVWSLPEALVTAELGSAFVSSSGGVIWVQNAFGDFSGAICGYFNWISGATDNAIYPALFLSYLTGNDLEGFQRFVYASAISLVLAGLNFLGLEIVGNANFIICVIAISPFIIMTFLGARSIDPSKWFQLPEANGSELFDDDFETIPGFLPTVSFGIYLRPFFNNMFWNLNSFDSAACFSEDVIDVKAYSRGIFIGLAFCYVLYILPLLIITGATDYNQEDWVDGFLATVARDIGGDFLGKWTVFAIGISNLALFEAEMSADAYQLMGMAEQGLLPSFFKKRSRFGTPTAGILTGTIFVIIFSLADFGQLVELLNANYAIALLMEYAAFVKLRHDRKDLNRPFRVPIPDSISILLVLPPCLGILLLLSVSSWMTYACIIFVFALCCGMVNLQRTSKERGWCQFEEPTPTPVLALSDSAHVLDYESLDGSTVEDSNDDCISILELANEKAKLIPVLSHISTCSEII